jgi:hypothetical protein
MTIPKNSVQPTARNKSARQRRMPPKVTPQSIHFLYPKDYWERKNTAQQSGNYTPVRRYRKDLTKTLAERKRNPNAAIEYVVFSPGNPGKVPRHFSEIYSRWHDNSPILAQQERRAQKAAQADLQRTVKMALGAGPRLGRTRTTVCLRSYRPYMPPQGKRGIMGLINYLLFR